MRDKERIVEMAYYLSKVPLWIAMIFGPRCWSAVYDAKDITNRKKFRNDLGFK